MRHLHLPALALVLACQCHSALAQEFPGAPPNLKEMEAKGLPRVSAEELKGFFPGVVDSKGTKGRHIITHNPDGSFLRKGFKHGLADVKGTWRIDEKNNTYCRGVPKQGRGLVAKGGYEENCFAVFRDPDGIHHFDYDVQDGFFAHVWRKATDQ